MDVCSGAHIAALADTYASGSMWKDSREVWMMSLRVIRIKGFTSPYHAVFIRAPVIEKVWGNCKILAKLEDKIILVQQGHLLAASFHPELTTDMRVHKYFLEMI